MILCTRTITRTTFGATHFGHNVTSHVQYGLSTYLETIDLQKHASLRRCNLAYQGS